MLAVLKQWFNRYLSDPEAILLLVLLIGFFSLLIQFGLTLAPVLLSIGLSYLLNKWVTLLTTHQILPKMAAYVVFIIFLTVFVLGFVLLLPLLWEQLNNLVAEVPTMIINLKSILTTVIANSTSNPNSLIPQETMALIMHDVLNSAQLLAMHIIAELLGALPDMVTLLEYLVLVPFIVFFLNYQILLATFVGCSVVVPYVGTVVATIPVLTIGYLQWGLTGGMIGNFLLLTYSYLVLQFIDGNILAPLLFSKALNLHPVAIILAVLLFGSMWGFWGIFFAVPLITLGQSVLNSWPK